MSSTRRGGQRSEADSYGTPEWCVHRLLEAVDLPGGLWLEPAVGNGNIVRAVSRVRDDVSWRGLDLCASPFLEKAKRAQYSYADFLSPELKLPHFDVCLTNPPFRLAEEFIRKACDVASIVVMLLRLNFLCSETRADFMRAHMPDVYPLPNRPSFVGGKTDSIEYAWMVWGQPRRRSVGKIQVLASTPKEVRRG